MSPEHGGLDPNALRRLATGPSNSGKCGSHAVSGDDDDDNDDNSDDDDDDDGGNSGGGAVGGGAGGGGTAEVAGTLRSG